MGKDVAGARSEAATVARAASATVNVVTASHDTGIFKTTPGGVAAAAAVAGVVAKSHVFWRALDVLASGDTDTRLEARDGTENPTCPAGRQATHAADDSALWPLHDGVEGGKGVHGCGERLRRLVLVLSVTWEEGTKMDLAIQ